jgi:hypothetical protein
MDHPLECIRLISMAWSKSHPTSANKCKWERISKRIKIVLASPDCGVALIAKFGQLEETEEQSIYINMNSRGLKHRLEVLASEGGIIESLELRDINVVLKFIEGESVIM